MKRFFTTAVLTLMISAVAVSCNKKVDVAGIQAKAEQVVSGNTTASVEVEDDGALHLSGTYADAATKDQAIAALKAIPGVKSVMDMTTITPANPVVATPEENLLKVKDALKDFPKVKASIVKGTITIDGEVSRADAMKIKQSVDALQVGIYNNNLIVD